jgi:hypothetical protein
LRSQRDDNEKVLPAVIFLGSLSRPVLMSTWTESLWCSFWPRQLRNSGLLNLN